jgi:hypothetical protein
LKKPATKQGRPLACKEFFFGSRENFRCAFRAPASAIPAKVLEATETPLLTVMALDIGFLCLR